jgi:hypothetical protein
LFFLALYSLFFSFFLKSVLTPPLNRPLSTSQCVGDQFAMLEATATLALVLRRFDFSFGPDGPGAVGLRTGATIHTQNGLWMRVRARAGVRRSGATWVEPPHPVLNPGGAALKQQLAQQLRQEEARLARDAAVAAAASVEPAP